MNIKETFLVTNIHTAIKILSAIIMNKIIAVYAGPSGLALIGQFQNFASVVTGLANGSIQTGIVKKIAENDEDSHRKKISNNALFLSISLAILVSLLVFIFAKPIAKYVLLDSNYKFLIYFFSFNIIFYSLNLYIISILNGLRAIKLYTIINIFISLYSLITVSFLTYLFGISGAIMGLILSQSLVFITSYFFIYKLKKYEKLSLTLDLYSLDKNTLKKLLFFGAASFASGLIFSLMMLIVRTFIINESSLTEAGIWEAAMRIGIYFNMIFALPISIHYLPIFSSVREKRQLLSHFKQAFKFIVPLIVLLFFLIILFDELIIQILFSREFLVASDILMFILMAEILRVIGLVFANLLVAKQWLLTNIINEFIMSCVFVSSALYLFESKGLYGVVIGYLIASIVYLLRNIFSFSTIYSSDQWKRID